MGSPLAMVHPPVEAKLPAPPYAGFIISALSSRIGFLFASPTAHRRFRRRPAFALVILSGVLERPVSRSSYSPGSSLRSWYKRLSASGSIVPDAARRTTKSPHTMGSTTPEDGVTNSWRPDCAAAGVSLRCDWEAYTAAAMSTPASTMLIGV